MKYETYDMEDGVTQCCVGALTRLTNETHESKSFLFFFSFLLLLSALYCGDPRVVSQPITRPRITLLLFCFSVFLS